MAKKVTEHDALKGVDLLLEPLTPEERQRVFDWIVLKYNAGTSSVQQFGVTAQPIGKPSTEFSSDKTVKEFIAAKKPDGYYERIACLAYFLEKFESMDGIKTADIVKANTDAKQTKFPNSTVYVNNATQKYGYLISAGKGKKTISAKGEALVEALPDREKVKAVVEAHPQKKAGNRKKKKKSKS